MRTIFLIMDSLNRHFLDVYNGCGKALTPNISRLAEKSVVFDNHWCGSMPCMPARREMMTGRLNFMETPWSAIQPWDQCLPKLLRQQKNTYSHMITDHYHYFHAGGECYHTLFDSWELERGQEGDVWKPVARDPKAPEKGRGKGLVRKAYWRNRECLDPEDDMSYPTPRCFVDAMEFLNINHDNDNWHLHLEVFDPHEPFDSPKKYRDMYNDNWDKYWYQWPEYAPLGDEDDEEAVQHIRKSYAATLTMADHWLGKFLDKMDELDMWKDTTLILTTDHGHLLGEHGYWAKNYMEVYRELAHIPLLICSPETTPGRREGMSATMDLMPTIMDLFGAKLPEFVHGTSLLPLLKEKKSVREETIFGYFAKDVNYTDGKYIYCRQPEQGAPVDHYTSIPRGFSDFHSDEVLRNTEAGVWMESQRGIPCWKIKEESSKHLNAPDFNPMYDLETDPQQKTPLHDEELENKLAEKLKALMKKYDVPECQYSRLSL